MVHMAMITIVTTDMAMDTHMDTDMAMNTDTMMHTTDMVRYSILTIQFIIRRYNDKKGHKTYGLNLIRQMIPLF